MLFEDIQYRTCKIEKFYKLTIDSTLKLFDTISKLGVDDVSTSILHQFMYSCSHNDAPTLKICLSDTGLNLILVHSRTLTICIVYNNDSYNIRLIFDITDLLSKVDQINSYTDHTYHMNILIKRIELLLN